MVCRILVPDQGMNPPPCPLQWKRAVLTTRPPGKALCSIFNPPTRFLFVPVAVTIVQVPSDLPTMAFALDLSDSISPVAAPWLRNATQPPEGHASVSS